MSGRDSDVGGDFRDQAAEWLVRVQSDQATDADWIALTAWLEASEAHRSAFDAVERLAAEVEAAAGDILPSLDRPSAPVFAIRAQTPAWRARAWAAGAVAIAASIAAAVIVIPMVWHSGSGGAEAYRTAIGETRTVRLADGTQIRMDAASSLTVRLARRERQVDLGDAEASFDVATDATRPFVISVGDQKVRVVGTEFNIRHYDRAMVLTVRRGIVEVLQPSLGTAPIARLEAGQGLRHADGTERSQQFQADPDQAFAWAQGRVVADNQPLPELVAYLNRRYPVPIRLSARAARMRFSGVLELSSEDALVRRLAGYLSLSVERNDREITLR